MDHMVFAAHAAFPMLLSPQLANLTWLNFNAYFQNGQPRKADPVVVSDLLNSGLARPVGYKQYELLPDVRLFLLFLLQDRHWFAASGVTFQAKRPLQELALFLKEFLASKTTSADSNSVNFRQMNQWVVSSYLEPGRLAGQLAETLQETFDLENFNDRDQAQLKLALVLRRFKGQADLDLYTGDTRVAEPLRNLYYYSEGNRARLFGAPGNVVTDLYGLVEVPYIGALRSPGRIRLPLTVDAGERLELKKNNIQRIYSLLIDVNDYPSGQLSDDFSRIQFLEKMMAVITERGQGQVQYAKQILLRNSDATKARIKQAAAELLQEAANEDLLFIYFGGHILQDSPLIALQSETFSPVEVRSFLDAACENKQTLIFLMLDSMLDNPVSFVRDKDIQLCTDHRIDNQSGFWRHFPYLFLQPQAWLTYAHMFVVLRSLLEQETNPQDEHPFLLIPENLKDCLFMSRKPKNIPRGSYPVFYDKEGGTWRIAEADFIKPPMNRTTFVAEYDLLTGLPDVQGEFYFGGLSPVFSGKTSGMNDAQVYLASPSLQPLYYSVDSNFSKLEEELLDEAILSAQPDNLASWDEPTKVSEGTYTEEKHPELWLKINRDEFAPLVFMVSLHSRASQRPYRWVIKQPEQLTSLLEKLGSFLYIAGLGQPDTYGSGKRPLSVTSRCSWQGMKTDTLPLGPGPVFLENGRIMFSPVEIRIESHENLTIYYQVYLAGADLALCKLSEKTGTIPPGLDITELFYLDAQLSALLFNDAPGFVKILYSRVPVFPDFSQTGFMNS